MIWLKYSTLLTPRCLALTFPGTTTIAKTERIVTAGAESSEGETADREEKAGKENRHNLLWGDHEHQGGCPYSSNLSFYFPFCFHLLSLVLWKCPLSRSASSTACITWRLGTSMALQLPDKTPVSLNNGGPVLRSMMPARPAFLPPPCV